MAMIILKVILFVVGFTLFSSSGLNLMECGDRIGPKYKKENITYLIVGIAIMIGVFFV